MSYLSVLAFFLTVISLNNITGNPKHQIHAQPSNGVIDYQPPPIDPETLVGHLNLSPQLLRSYNRPTIGGFENIPHIIPRRPVRPPA